MHVQIIGYNQNMSAYTCRPMYMYSISLATSNVEIRNAVYLSKTSAVLSKCPCVNQLLYQSHKNETR